MLPCVSSFAQLLRMHALSPEPMSDIRQVLPGAPTAQWTPWGSYQDILVDRCADGLARVAINRPAKRNAFRPQTVMELCDAFTRIRDDRDIGVVLFTGVGPCLLYTSPSPRDGLLSRMPSSA